jgi:hypothetical protein
VRYPYTAYSVNPSLTIPDGIVHRPEVILRILGDSNEVYLTALVDTGADETILPLWVAEVTGAELHPDEITQAIGIAGQQLEVVAGTVQLELVGDDESFGWPATIGFAHFESPDDEYAILGHAGCLNLFTLTFDAEKREVTITTNANFPRVR